MQRFNAPKLIAHRGASAFAPENTLAAIHKAKAMGATWVEFDVTLTADHVAVCLHDETLERTTNGEGLIFLAHYSDIKKLDAGSWFSQDFCNESIPSLEEMISCINECGMGMNIEIKPTNGLTLETVEQVITILNTCWQKKWPQPLITSFDFAAIRHVYELKPDALTGLLLDEWTNDWQTMADSINAVTIHMSKYLATSDRIEAIHATQRKVMAYTVNNYAEAQQLFAHGVDGIFSDYPNLLDPPVV